MHQSTSACARALQKLIQLKVENVTTATSNYCIWDSWHARMDATEFTQLL